MRGEFDEYVKEWLVLGPFFPDDLETDFLADVGGEANMEPREGDTVTTSDGRRLIWKRYISETNIVDLLDAIGNYEHATAYAFCTIQSEVAGDAMFRLASDDGVAIWINGRQVYQNRIERFLNLDSEDVFDADLRAGTNLCLLKIYNVTRDWEFRMRMPLPNRAVISGVVVNEEGNPISDAHVQLWWNEEEVAYTYTDYLGKYALDTHPLQGSFDLSAHSVDMGGWHTGILLGEGEYRTLNFTLKEAISIEGKLFMPDNATPHVAVPVQAIRGGKVVEVAHSDARGTYHFANLKPELYQLRCQVPGGYVYYGEEKARKPVGTRHAVSLQIEGGRTLRNINFRFLPTIKGVWRNYNYLDGLADNVVMAIHRDPDGIMWFATYGGISRFDGKEFANLTTRDGLVHNWVRAIHRDPGGVMWFATAGGISRYDGKEFANLTTEDGLVDKSVWCIHCDPDGIMWFGTEGGISRYDGREFINLTTKDGLMHNWIHAIHRDADGVMWFGTGNWGREGGVSRYDGKKFINFTREDGLVANTVWAIHRDPDGVLWLGGGGGGVSRYDGKEFSNIGWMDGMRDITVHAIHRDTDGVMWFGAYRCASRYDGKGFTHFTTENGLAHNWVNAIYRDPDGVMWFGTGNWIAGEGGGISRYDEREFTHLTMKEGLVYNNVRAIHRDPDGVMWFGTSEGRLGGVSRYDGKEFVNLTTEDGLVANGVQVICRDRNGAMWFGTRGGLSRYDGKEFTNFTMKDGLASNNIQSICCDTDGMMWFGMGWTGMSRYDGKEFVSFRPRDGLAGERVASMLCDPDGVMWFGTDRGISRYDGKEFVHLTTGDGLVWNPILSIYRDPDGILWFGTEGDGVSRYNGETFVNFSTEDGLAHHTIQSIHRDPDGLMWFATRGGGVSGYDGIAWTSLDVRDGLTSNNVNLIHQYPDGSLWFATDRGITIYRRNTIPPKVRIVSVTTDQTYMLKTQDARLETERSSIPALIVGQRVTIEYSAIDFKTVPEKRQYRCCVYETGDMRRETSDSRPGTSDPEVESQVSSLKSHVPYNPPTKDTTFDWIPQEPGTYIFQVQAIDRDLNYSEPATLNLTVQPDPVIVSMQTELNHLRREVVEKYHFENLIGHSASIRQVRALMERAIDSGLTALIIGETGTGKELVAKAIHYNSTRKGKPLLARNCGAIPKDLLASDLFGHRKGAFTGATEDKMGLFEAASGGTVLLDEISEMPEDAQVHLLRVLQEREVQRLGEYTSREVDVRIIAMTNRDLAEEVKADRFREDLYHRLNEFPIHIPPLREHSEDIPLLAEHFLNEYSQEQKQELGGFASDVLEMLQSYPWPGNVRELRNVIRRAAALAEEGRQIQTYHFPPQITHGESLIQEVLSDQLNYTDSVTRFRRRFMEEILRECDGNRSEAARRLGMDRSNLRNLMKRLEVKE